MVDFKYLQLGIAGLANAYPLGTMAGHLGAAVVAGYFIGEDNSHWPDEVFGGVEKELTRIISGEKTIWYDVDKTGVTPKKLFQPSDARIPPANEKEPVSIGSIADALKTNSTSLRQSGHNVIFGSLAIRALKSHREFATPANMAGIRKLIEGFNHVGAGRAYFGKEQGWKTAKQIKLDKHSTTPNYESSQSMVAATIDELFQSASIRRQGFGGLWHLINHAAAIVELERMGFVEIANQALPVHHQHLQLWRSLPDLESELGPVEKSKHDPQTKEYWQTELKRNGAQLTHRIKTLFGYHTIRRLIDDQDKTGLADDAFRCLML